MFNWFDKIADGVKFIGQKANDAWQFIGEHVKPIVHTGSHIGRFVNDTIVKPFISEKAGNFIDKALDGLDYLSGAYDKADEFKNKLTKQIKQVRDENKSDIDDILGSWNRWNIRASTEQQKMNTRSEASNEPSRNETSRGRNANAYSDIM
jgi:hypothetical protein